MNNLEQCLSYLVPPEGYFWSWDESGECAVWQDGSSLAFRAELENIIEHLAPYGLPSPGALMIVIGATRKNWDPSRVRMLFEKALQEIPVFDHYSKVLDSVFKNLNHVNKQIPDSLRSSSLSCSLCELMLRSTGDYLGFQESKQVVETLKQGISGEELCNSLPKHSVSDIVVKDLETLESSLKNFDSGNIFNSVKTGISTVPESLKLEARQETAISIKALLQNDKLKGLGQIVQNLIAVINLPRSVSELTHLPLGGVSDITNRGNLDNLLISELANDDLTLAVRIASNEALYIRRESPPGHPPVKKKVFLDHGIRYLGKSRVYALAVAVSLSLKCEKHEETQFLSLMNERFQEVILNSEEDIVSMLEVLQTGLSPVDALSRYFMDSNSRDLECLFIFHEKQLLDPRLNKLLKDLKIPVYTLFLINEEGHFKMVRVTESEKKILVTAKLDLDILDSSMKKEPIFLPKESSGELPAFYSYTDAPLNVSFWDKIRAESIDHNYFMTSPRVLYRVRDQQTKVTPLNIRVPENTSKVHLEEDRLYFLIDKGQKKTVYGINFNTHIEVCDFTISFKEHFWKSEFYKGFLYCYEKEVKFSLSDTTKSSIISSDLNSFEAALKSKKENRFKLSKSGAKICRFQKIFLKRDSASLYFQQQNGNTSTLSEDRNYAHFHDVSRYNIGSCMEGVFRPYEPPEGEGYKLSKASFSDGSTVILDRRGFMHLVSSDKSIPEITILLNKDNTAFWTSDGAFMGNEKYLNNGSVSEEKVLRHIQSFISQVYI